MSGETLHPSGEAGNSFASENASKTSGSSASNCTSSNTRAVKDTERVRPFFFSSGLRLPILRPASLPVNELDRLSVLRSSTTLWIVLSCAVRCTRVRHRWSAHRFHNRLEAEHQRCVRNFTNILRPPPSATTFRHFFRSAQLQVWAGDTSAKKAGIAHPVTMGEQAPTQKINHTLVSFVTMFSSSQST